LGAVLLALGLAERIDAPVAPAVRAPAFDEERDPELGARNVRAVAMLAIEQADHVCQILGADEFPVVLGGDDSVLLGCLLALRRLGSTGLVLLDGHTDFWDLLNGTGELSDSDPVDRDRSRPQRDLRPRGAPAPVPARACVVYGHRDRALQLRDGSRDVYREPMLVRNLAELRAVSIEDAANHAAAFLAAANVDRVWLHLDADCLDDELMPAVDWRLDGGLTPSEVVGLTRPLVSSGLIAGMDVTIYNPGLDTDDHAAGRVLLDVVDAILA
jgi:arginase